MGDKKRVTIAELAQELGYSKSTISRALSGKGRLSSETRENILRYCEMSGYRSKATLDKKWMTRNYNYCSNAFGTRNIGNPFFLQLYNGYM